MGVCVSEGTHHSHVSSGDVLPSLGQSLGVYTRTSGKGVYDPPLGYTVWGERIACRTAGSRWCQHPSCCQTLRPLPTQTDLVCLSSSGSRYVLNKRM